MSELENNNKLPYDDSDPKSIEEYARLLLHRSIRPSIPIDSLVEIAEKIGKNKGLLGQLVEEFHFLYKPNSDPGPDFPKAGVELKTAGMLKRGSRLVPKEPRLSLSMIDYDTVCDENWSESSLLKKNSLLLLMFYLYQEEQLPLDYIFKIVTLWEFPERDLRIIEQDWHTIVNKIKTGRAHELSEGDTYYLGASTKGATAKTSFVNYRFSDTPAKKRAFSIKKTYLETVIADCLAKEKATESIIKDTELLPKDSTFENYVIQKFEPFLGSSVNEIARALELELNLSSKDRFAKLARAIMGVTTSEVEEFAKADVQMKTIRIQNNGRPKESMSFPYFKYMEIINEEWDDSTLREQFSKKFFFVVYRPNDKDELLLHKVFFWNMPYQDLEGEVQNVWQRTVGLIKAGKAETLPKSSESTVCHLRPHGRDSRDTLPAPGGLEVVKKCFWLNSGYIGDIIESAKA